ncbi:MAG: PglZ domain-containing protein, partial [Candidatus Njordarchaeales archaeon]
MNLYVEELLNRGDPNLLSDKAKKNLANYGIIRSENNIFRISTPSEFLSFLEEKADTKEAIKIFLRIYNTIKENDYVSLTANDEIFNAIYNIADSKWELVPLTQLIIAGEKVFGLYKIYRVEKKSSESWQSYSISAKLLYWALKKISKVRKKGSVILINPIYSENKFWMLLTNIYRCWRNEEKMINVLPILLWRNEFLRSLILSATWMTQIYFLKSKLEGSDNYVAEQLAFLALDLAISFGEGDPYRFIKETERLEKEFRSLIDIDYNEMQDLGGCIPKLYAINEVIQAIDEFEFSCESINEGCLQTLEKKISSLPPRYYFSDPIDIILQNLTIAKKPEDFDLLISLIEFYIYYKRIPSREVVLKAELLGYLYERLISVEDIFPTTFILREILNFEIREWSEKKRNDLLRWAFNKYLISQGNFHRIVKLLVGLFLAMIIARKEKLYSSQKHLYDALLLTVNNLGRTSKMPHRLIIEAVKYEYEYNALTYFITVLEFLLKHRSKSIIHSLKLLGNKIKVRLAPLIAVIAIVYYYYLHLIERASVLALEEFPDLLNILKEIVEELNMDMRNLIFAIPAELDRVNDYRNLDVNELEERLNIMEQYNAKINKEVIKIIIEGLNALSRNVTDSLLDLAEQIVDLQSIRNSIRELRPSYRGTYLIKKLEVDLERRLLELEDYWQNIFFDKYISELSRENLTISDIETHVKSLKNIMGQITGQQVLILIVIDGLRYDSYQTKIKPILESFGFEIQDELKVVSLIPSITNFSRRGIFNLDIPEFFYKHKKSDLPEGEKIPSEKRLFIKNHYKQRLYLAFSRSISEALDWFTRKYSPRKNQKMIAIVLQSFEKVQHGASEEAAAIINREFARSIGSLAVIIKDALSKRNKVPVFVITSDHGLVMGVSQPIEVDLDEMKKRCNCGDNIVIDSRYMIIWSNERLPREEIRNILKETLRVSDFFIAYGDELKINYVWIAKKKVPGANV